MAVRLTNKQVSLPTSSKAATTAHKPAPNASVGQSERSLSTNNPQNKLQLDLLIEPVDPSSATNAPTVADAFTMPGSTQTKTPTTSEGSTFDPSGAATQLIEHFDAQTLTGVFENLNKKSRSKVISAFNIAAQKNNAPAFFDALAKADDTVKRAAADLGLLKQSSVGENTSGVKTNLPPQKAFEAISHISSLLTKARSNAARAVNVGKKDPLETYAPVRQAIATLTPKVDSTITESLGAQYWLAQTETLASAAKADFGAGKIVAGRAHLEDAINRLGRAIAQSDEDPDIRRLALAKRATLSVQLANTWTQDPRLLERRLKQGGSLKNDPMLRVFYQDARKGMTQATTQAVDDLEVIANELQAVGKENPEVKVKVDEKVAQLAEQIVVVRASGHAKLADLATLAGDIPGQAKETTALLGLTLERPDISALLKADATSHYNQKGVQVGGFERWFSPLSNDTEVGHLSEEKLDTLAKAFAQQIENHPNAQGKLALDALVRHADRVASRGDVSATNVAAQLLERLGKDLQRPDLNIRSLLAKAKVHQGLDSPDLTGARRFFAEARVAAKKLPHQELSQELQQQAIFGEVMVLTQGAAGNDADAHALTAMRKQLEEDASAGNSPLGTNPLARLVLAEMRGHLAANMADGAAAARDHLRTQYLPQAQTDPDLAWLAESVKAFDEKNTTSGLTAAVKVFINEANSATLGETAAWMAGGTAVGIGTGVTVAAAITIGSGGALFPLAAVICGTMGAVGGFTVAPIALAGRKAWGGRQKITQAGKTGLSDESAWDTAMGGVFLGMDIIPGFAAFKVSKQLGKTGLKTLAKGTLNHEDEAVAAMMRGLTQRASRDIAVDSGEQALKKMTTQELEIEGRKLLMREASKTVLEAGGEAGLIGMGMAVGPLGAEAARIWGDDTLTPDEKNRAFGKLVDQIAQVGIGMAGFVGAGAVLNRVALQSNYAKALTHSTPDKMRAQVLTDANFGRWVDNTQKFAESRGSGGQSTGPTRASRLKEEGIGFDPLTGRIQLSENVLTLSDVALQKRLQHEVTHGVFHSLPPVERRAVLAALTEHPNWEKIKANFSTDQGHTTIDSIADEIIAQMHHTGPETTALVAPILQSDAFKKAGLDQPVSVDLTTLRKTGTLQLSNSVYHNISGETQGVAHSEDLPSWVKDEAEGYEYYPGGPDHAEATKEVVQSSLGLAGARKWNEARGIPEGTPLSLAHFVDADGLEVLKKGLSEASKQQKEPSDFLLFAEGLVDEAKTAGEFLGPKEVNAALKRHFGFGVAIATSAQVSGASKAPTPSSHLAEFAEGGNTKDAVNRILAVSTGLWEKDASPKIQKAIMGLDGVFSYGDNPFLASALASKIEQLATSTGDEAVIAAKIARAAKIYNSIHIYTRRSDASEATQILNAAVDGPWEAKHFTVLPTSDVQTSIMAARGDGLPLAFAAVFKIKPAGINAAEWGQSINAQLKTGVAMRRLGFTEDDVWKALSTGDDAVKTSMVTLLIEKEVIGYDETLKGVTGEQLAKIFGHEDATKRQSLVAEKTKISVEEIHSKATRVAEGQDPHANLSAAEAIHQSYGSVPLERIRIALDQQGATEQSLRTQIRAAEKMAKDFGLDENALWNALDANGETLKGILVEQNNYPSMLMGNINNLPAEHILRLYNDPVVGGLLTSTERQFHAMLFISNHPRLDVTVIAERLTFGKALVDAGIDSSKVYPRLKGKLFRKTAYPLIENHLLEVAKGNVEGVTVDQAVTALKQISGTLGWIEPNFKIRVAEELKQSKDNTEAQKGLAALHHIMVDGNNSQ